LACQPPIDAAPQFDPSSAGPAGKLKKLDDRRYFPALADWLVGAVTLGQEEIEGQQTLAAASSRCRTAMTQRLDTLVKMRWAAEAQKAASLAGLSASAKPRNQAETATTRKLALKRQETFPQGGLQAAAGCSVF
jgi:hypothetical protein